MNALVARSCPARSKRPPREVVSRLYQAREKLLEHRAVLEKQYRPPQPPRKVLDADDEKEMLARVFLDAQQEKSKASAALESRLEENWWKETGATPPQPCSAERVLATVQRLHSGAARR